MQRVGSRRVAPLLSRWFLPCVMKLKEVSSKRPWDSRECSWVFESAYGHHSEKRLRKYMVLEYFKWVCQ